MKKSNPVWILVIIIVFLLLVINIVFFVKIKEHTETLSDLNSSINVIFMPKTETGEKCPDAEGGMGEAFLQVKYFYSEYCPWCKKEEPILQKMIDEYGNLVHIGWYNLNDCPKLVKQYEVGGVPTLVFSTTENPTEYSHYGFVYENDLKKLICDVTGGC